jgi:hypothetical protein
MKSPKAFSHNVKVEMENGKPQKQAVAIAYSEQDKAKHKAHMFSGGPVQDCPLCSKRPPEENQREEGEESDNSLAGYSDGGSVEGILGTYDPDNPVAKGVSSVFKAEGGMVDEGESDIDSMLGDELLGAFEAKDKKRIMEGIEAIVLSCMNKGAE